MNTLVPQKNVKLHRLLPDRDENDPLEASGVLVHDGRFLVVFDNTSRIASIDAALSRDGDNGWIGEPDASDRFEDITYDSRSRHFYTLVEAVPVGSDRFRAEVITYDQTFNRLAQHQLPFNFKKENKGFEGIAFLRRDDNEYLLALCEGNLCQGGDEGREPGNGRIQMFRCDSPGWTHTGTLHLPAAAWFHDYSSLDIQDSRVAVLSQESSQVWFGTLAESSWDFVDAGVVYQLPCDEDEDPIYCNAEGIAWITPSRLVIASDQKKRESPDRCGEQDQSLHIFDIPPFNES